MVDRNCARGVHIYRPGHLHHVNPPGGAGPVAGSAKEPFTRFWGPRGSFTKNWAPASLGAVRDSRIAVVALLPVRQASEPVMRQTVRTELFTAEDAEGELLRTAPK